MLLAFEHGVLPANLHFDEPNPNSAGLKDGILKASLPLHALALSLELSRVASCAVGSQCKLSVPLFPTAAGGDGAHSSG